jgi:hypothetical protein
MESKKWYQSKTIWGIVIAFVGYLLSNSLQVHDVSVPANADFDSLKELINQIKDAQGNVSVIAGQIMGIIGTIIAIYGRIKSDSKIA